MDSLRLKKYVQDRKVRLPPKTPDRLGNLGIGYLTYNLDIFAYFYFLLGIEQFKSVFTGSFSVEDVSFSVLNFRFSVHKLEKHSVVESPRMVATMLLSQ